MKSCKKCEYIITVFDKTKIDLTFVCIFDAFNQRIIGDTVNGTNPSRKMPKWCPRKMHRPESYCPTPKLPRTSSNYSQFRIIPNAGKPQMVSGGLCTPK